MALRPDQIDDFVNLTLSNFKRSEWTDISLEYPEYIASRVITKKKVQERGGPDIRFKVQVRNAGLARNTGLYAKDVTGVEDLTTEGVVTWTKQTVNWSYDIDEPLFQSDRETIISEMLMREHSCHNDMAELNEENLWGSPSSNTDSRPTGIPFWIQKDASTTPGGAFNGGNPTGWDGGAAGISSTTYPRWKNWTFGYTSVAPDDLVVKVKKSLYKTKFKAPHPHPELGFGKSDHSIFTVYDVREPLERLAESRNDNLGKDVAKYINDVLIGGVPVEAVHYLDANDSDNPLYGVNWKVLRPYVKKGANMRRTKKNAPFQHTVREVHYDTWMNWICYNRRMLWCGSKA
jgi:hypothetical protein